MNLFHDEMNGAFCMYVRGFLSMKVTCCRDDANEGGCAGLILTKTNTFEFIDLRRILTYHIYI